MKREQGLSQRYVDGLDKFLMCCVCGLRWGHRKRAEHPGTISKCTFLNDQSQLFDTPLRVYK